jgi:CPA1 family monovalent cation:H+ antiporter
VRRLYEYRQRRFGALAGHIEDDEGYEQRSEAYQRLQAELLNAQRSSIVVLRNQGQISNEVMHRIERELDFEEGRMENDPVSRGSSGNQSP